MSRAAPDLAPHLEGLAEGRLVVAECAVCGASALPPTALCHRCGAGAGWDWREASGEGRLWSCVEFHQDYLRRPDLPVSYVVALVELVEGPLLHATVSQPYDGLVPGTAVRVRVDPGDRDRGRPPAPMVVVDDTP